MAGLVVLKSFNHGISIYLDPEAEFSVLSEAVAEKFREAASFFKDAQVAVSFENRSLSETEEKALLGIISSNSDVRVLCIVGKDENTEKHFIKALKHLSAIEESEAYFYKGSLKNGKKIDVEENIVILGDVNPGCTIVSDKNIIIMGGLYGQAIAGKDEQEGHFVAALEMSPEMVMIDGIRYKSHERAKWSIIPKVQPKLAYEKDGKVQMENITKELLNSLPF